MGVDVLGVDKMGVEVLRVDLTALIPLHVLYNSFSSCTTRTMIASNNNKHTLHLPRPVAVTTIKLLKVHNAVYDKKMSKLKISLESCIGKNRSASLR